MRASKATVGRARTLRRELTFPEVLLWQALRGGRLSGIRFGRQHPVGRYVLDFFCSEARLAVEVDGAAHDHPDRAARDDALDAWLASQDIGVLRFRARDLLTEDGRQAVLATIAARLAAPSGWSTELGLSLHRPIKARQADIFGRQGGTHTMRSTMLLAAAVLTALALPATAETLNYKATILPSSEVPPVTNSQATGQLAATYDTASKVLSYGVTYSGTTGPATAAHFHGPAPVGKNAGVMVPINGDLASPIKGTATLTDEQAKALTDGDMYFNIHTAANKGGEMRGQVVKAN